MMSENSSFINFRTMQKNLFRSRLWLTALALLVFFVFFVGFTVFWILAVQAHPTVGLSGAEDFRQSEESLTRSLVPVITVIGAALLGLQGYAWMDKRRELDFYESLPVSRGRRFWNIYLNGWFIYLGSYVITLAIGLAIVYGAGLGSGGLLNAEMVILARNIFLFGAVYGASILAVMLTGNILVAVFVDAVLLLYELALDYIVQMYRESLLWTYVSDSMVFTYVFSPIASYMKGVWPGIGLNLLSGAAVTILAFFLYRYRKNEDAGKSVFYKPVRRILKIAETFEVSLVVGLIFLEAGGVAAGSAAALVTAVVIGCIMEVIYDFNVRRAFRNIGAALIGGLGGIVLMCCFRFDVMGYDSWTPDPAQVQSAYLSFSNNYTNYITDDAKGEMEGASDFAKQYMELTDIDAVNELLAAGEKNTKYSWEETQDEGDNWTIGFRMKDGKEKCRRVWLPYSSENTEILDDIVGSEEFREGYFQVWHDSFIESHLNRTRISYWNGRENEQGDSASVQKRLAASEYYGEFRKAYREDLKQFDYSYAVRHYPIGEIDIEISDDTVDEETDSNYWDIEMPVYENFSHTIAFLKKAGIYMAPISPKDADYLQDIQNLDGVWSFRSSIGMDGSTDESEEMASSSSAETE